MAGEIGDDEKCQRAGRRYINGVFAGGVFGMRGVVVVVGPGEEGLGR